LTVEHDLLYSTKTSEKEIYLKAKNENFVIHDYLMDADFFEKKNKTK